MATEERLIYANVLKKVFEDSLEGTYTIKDSKTASVMAGTLIACGILIDEQPTVDAVEVVHGRWVIEKRHTVSTNPYMDDNYHAHVTCSECGFCIHSENASFGYPKLNTTNYCPNCGAKMDGDNNGS